MNLRSTIVLLVLTFISQIASAQCKAKMYYTVQGDTVSFYGDSSKSVNGHYFFWSFGDGTSANTYNPRHIFKNGTFTVCLTIIDTASKCTDSACTSLTIYKPAPCKAIFTWRNSTPQGGKPVIWFSDSSYNVMSKFNFGDNSSKIRYRNMSENVFHTYDSAGTYNVCLMVYDLNSKGDTVLCDSSCSTVVITKPSCQANFTYNISGKTVTFKTTGSGNFYRIYWYYGDGNNYSRFTDTNDTYVYTYKTNGKYVAYLYFYDSANMVCSYFSDTLVINDSSSCKALYTYTVSGDTVFFVNKSTGNWKSERWNMGDGSVIDRLGGMSSSFYYVYKCKGSYTPLLSLFENINFYYLCDQYYDTITTNGATGCKAKFTYTISTNKVTLTNASSGSYCYEQWDFGDGTTTSYPRGYTTSTIHTYNKTGRYLVCYKLYDNSGICSQICDTILITQFKGSCKLGFAWEQRDCQYGNKLELKFTDSFSGLYTRYDFGDSTGISPPYSVNTIFHNYDSAGIYNVCAYRYVLDSLGDTILCGSICNTITINPSRNQAEFNVKINCDTVVFTNISKGNWNFEFWDFGDGDTSSTFVGSNGTITHVYKKSGEFTPWLMLNDTSGKGGCTTFLDTIHVGNGNCCQASFYVGIDTNTKGVLYIIQNSKGTTSNTNYYWNFGDGTSSNAKNPTHKYSNFGLYKLCLTITDSSRNCSNTYCDSVGLDSNGKLLKLNGFTIMVVDEGSVLSILKEREWPTIQIYPNPGNGLLKLSFDGKEAGNMLITCTNNVGQLLKSEPYAASLGKNELLLDYSQYKPGIYFIKVELGNQSKTFKVFIQNN